MILFNGLMSGLKGKHSINPQMTNQRLRFILSRTGLLFSGSILIGGAAGANWGSAYVQEQIAPRVAQSLSESLNRPVELGKVEQVTPTSLRFGISAIPATAEDRDQVTIQAIEVHFNPLDLMRKGKLGLTVTLIQPKAFLDQDQEGEWFNTEILLDGDDWTEVQHIQLQDAAIVLSAPEKSLRVLSQSTETGIPAAINQVTLQQINGSLALGDDTPLVFDIQGQAAQGGNFRISGEAFLETEAVDLSLQTRNLAVTALNPLLPATARLDAGFLTSQLSLHLHPDQPVAIEGTAELQEIAAQVEEEPNLFTHTSGQFQFQEQQIRLSNGRTTYGYIPFEQIQGTIDLENGLDLTAAVRSVSAAAFMQTFELELPFATSGSLQTAELRITGPLEQAMFSGKVKSDQPLQFDRLKMASAHTDFTYDTGTDYLKLIDTEFTPAIGGKIIANAQIELGEEDEGESDQVVMQVETKQLPADAITNLYGLTLPAPTNSPFTLGSFNAKADVSVIDENPKVTMQWTSQGTATGRGKITFENDAFQLQETQIQLAAGTLQAEGKLAQKQWQARIWGSQLPLNQVLPHFPGVLQGEVALSGRLDRPDAVEGEAQAEIQLETGSLQIKGSAKSGRWQAQMESSGISLSPFATDLPGVLRGELALTGTTTDLHPDAIQAEGQLQFSEGISRKVALLNQPLTTQFRWQGDRLQIQQATIAGLDIDGWVTAELSDLDAPGIKNLDLNIKLEDYDLTTLKTLPFTASMPLEMTGLANFSGRLTGTPDTPVVKGKIQLQELTLQQFAFAPLLDGTIDFNAAQGLNLNLAGDRNRIALVLDRNYRPAAFTIQLEEAIAQGKLEYTEKQQRLLATVQNFPLGLFTPSILGMPVNGALSGQLNADLTDTEKPEMTAEVMIDRPAIGSIDLATHPEHRGDRFQGKLTYTDGVASLTAGELQLGAGHYRLNGSLKHGDYPELTGQFQTDQGDIQGIFTVLQGVDWRQHSNLASSPVLSALSNLQGAFAADVQFQMSQPTGLSVNFNAQGQDWLWKGYRLHHLSIAEGHFDGNQLTLKPVQLKGLTYQTANQNPQNFETQLLFSGQVGRGQQLGQLQIDDLPIALLSQLWNVSLPLQGNIQATATVAGSLNNPLVTGEVEMMQASVNGRALPANKMAFSYKDAQFRVQDWQMTEPNAE